MPLLINVEFPPLVLQIALTTKFQIKVKKIHRRIAIDEAGGQTNQSLRPAISALCPHFCCLLTAVPSKLDLLLLPLTTSSASGVPR
jgi:hypothetical protein